MKKNNHAARTARAMFWRSLLNDDVKFSYLRFWRQRKLAAVNLSLFAFSWKPFVPARESVVRVFCTTWSTWNNRKRSNWTQSSILMRRFRCSCRRSFLNSLFLKLPNTPEMQICLEMHTTGCVTTSIYVPPQRYRHFIGEKYRYTKIIKCPPNYNPWRDINSNPNLNITRIETLTLKLQTVSCV